MSMASDGGLIIFATVHQRNEQYFLDFYFNTKIIYENNEISQVWTISMTLCSIESKAKLRWKKNCDRKTF